MGDRTFPLVSIRRADYGPRQSAQEITCAVCGERDQVVNASGLKIMPPVMAARKFRDAGWVVGTSQKDDRCPNCSRRSAPPRKLKDREAMPTVEKSTTSVGVRSTDAVLARKICDDLLMEHLDLEARTYQTGWSDERIAKESGWSVEAVKRRREADYFQIAEAIRPEEVAIIAKSLVEGMTAIATSVERLGAVALEEVAARQALQQAVAAMREKIGAVDRLARKR